jgi:6-pyruvoyltetrahydropterin/6-carboxytetrahydropterin synthase
MYQLMVKRDFVAQHFLTVPDCGPENEWHSHHFTVEVLLEGDQLNEHGYLIDIDEVNDALATLVGRYRDSTLNELPEFENLNPSIEHFARIFLDQFMRLCDMDNRLQKTSVKIWEDDLAWASFASST